MEREVWVRAGMFGTIIVLVGLILITPSYLPHPSALTSLPILIVAMTSNEKSVIVDVTGALQAYLYDNITLNVTGLDVANGTPSSWNVGMNDTYNAEVYIPANLTSWRIHVWLTDHQGNYFEYNVTLRLFLDPSNGDRLTMSFTFPDDPGTAEQFITPPSDFRWPVPRRGVLP